MGTSELTPFEKYPGSVTAAFNVSRTFKAFYPLNTYINLINLDYDDWYAYLKGNRIELNLLIQEVFFDDSACYDPDVKEIFVSLLGDELFFADKEQIVFNLIRTIMHELVHAKQYKCDETADFPSRLSPDALDDEAYYNSKMELEAYAHDIYVEFHFGAGQYQSIEETPSYKIYSYRFGPDTPTIKKLINYYKRWIKFYKNITS